MYAIIQQGGQQHRIEPGMLIDVDRIDAAEASQIEIDQVLAVSDEDGLQLGQPLVAGAAVTAEVVAHFRDKKIVVFKMKRRKGLHRRQGHRQELTRLRIQQIKVGDKVAGVAAAAE